MMFITGKVPVFGTPCHTLDTVKIGWVHACHMVARTGSGAHWCCLTLQTSGNQEDPDHAAELPHHGQPTHAHTRARR